MIRHSDISDTALHHLVRTGKVLYGGHRKLRIYGLLRCISGKRMQRRNRVFFASEREALAAGYRPCGHCCRAAYQRWKDG